MNDRLHYYQYVFMAALFTAAGIFLPALVRNTAGTGAYLCYLFALPAGIAGVVVTCAVFKRAKGPLAAYSYAFGKTAARVICAVNAVWLTFLCAQLLAYYALFALNDSAMSSLALFIIPVSAGICFAACGKTSSLGRTAVILGSVILIAAAVFFGISLFGGKLSNLYTLRPPDSADTLVRITGCLWALMFSETSAVTALSGALENRDKLIRSTVLPVLAGGIAVLITFILDVIINGQTSGAYEPSYGAAKDTSGVAVIAAAALFFASVFRCTVCLHSAGVYFTQAFRIKRRRAVVITLGICAAAAAFYLSRSMRFLNEFMIRFSWIPSIAIGVGLPLTCLLFGYIRRSRRANNTKY